MNGGVNRRAYLSALGIALASTTAGCNSGGDQNETTSTATPSPTAAPTPNNEAVSHYETAIGALVENKETLDEWAASSFEPELVSSLQERVNTAREELDAAEETYNQSGDFTLRITQARLVANFQELILAYYESVNVYFQLISDGRSLGNNESHQRAAERFAQAQSVLEDTRTVIDDMGTQLSELANNSLDEPELEYSGEPLDHLDLEDQRALDGVESIAIAYENIHLAFVQLETGRNHYENEEFTEAREAWEAGRERATDANSAFDAAIDNEYTPQNLNEESIQLVEATETIIEAFDNFVEGAQAAEAGNMEEANNLVLEGFSLLEQL